MKKHRDADALAARIAEAANQPAAVVVANRQAWLLSRKRAEPKRKPS
jgi:hypothetical protein